MDATGNDDSKSYFSAAGQDGGLRAEVERLKLLQQQLIANRNNAGSPSRGPLLQRPNVIIPQTGAAQYWHVDPNASRPQMLPASLPPDELQKRLQLLPANSPFLLMQRKLPRFAGERDDLLHDIDNTFYGGGHAPAPTPTPTPTSPRYFPISYFT